MQGIDFIAIDFETATGLRASICEAGITVVRDGAIVETRSWLVRPQDNIYSYWNMRIHGITPDDTAHSPTFPTVWNEISHYLDETPVLVAHNAAFDMSCIRSALQFYGIECPHIPYYCTLRAARRIYDYGCNTLNYLCDQLAIPYRCHHRAGDDALMCARLFLRELHDSGHHFTELDFCSGCL